MEAPWTNLDPSFTFSEAELCDVLTFVSGLADDADADGVPASLEGVALPRIASRAQLAAGTPTRSLASGLQFQPHQREGPPPPGLQFHPKDSPQAAYDEGGAGAASGGEEGDGVPKVSHGASEKQRRDRINSMIDQLRHIGGTAAVPGDPPKASRSGGGGEGGEGRRSKYLVLQQTIGTLKSLQSRVAAQEEELARLRAAAAAAAEGSGGGGAAAGGTPSTSADLPAVPATAPPGVEVHPGAAAGTCYVRVACVDRRGLLADILNALRAMPCEVVRAAITTSADGLVNDVFELRPAADAGGAPLRAADIKAAVERQLLAAASRGAEEGKRRKVSTARAAAAARDA